MKRIIIIFIIAVCLISFAGIYYLAKEPLNVAKTWESLSIYEKEWYLIGISDGVMKTLADFNEYEKCDEKVREIITLFINEKYDFLPYLWSNRNAVIKAMSDLYKDLANVYISAPSICFLAIRKLKGESIESSLREARKKALP